jgi:hypothetical protein
MLFLPIATLKGQDRFFTLSLRLANADCKGVNNQWSLFDMRDKGVAVEEICLF